MFSSGLDSFILKKIMSFEEHECFFVNMGTKENDIEEQNIKQHFPNVRRIHLSIEQFELKNNIIPFRNVFLALAAANFANTIYFAFTAGDTTKDKDFVFKSQVEGILNYFSIDENKVSVPGPFSIEMPMKNMTKKDIVARYLKEGGDSIALHTKSFSCYEGTVMPCGKCRSCLRKFCALVLNNVECRGFFQNWPADYLQTHLEESIKKGRKQQEIEEIKQCIHLKQQ
jgi:hypothetical protein